MHTQRCQNVYNLVTTQIISLSCTQKIIIQGKKIDFIVNVKKYLTLTPSAVGPIHCATMRGSSIQLAAFTQLVVIDTKTSAASAPEKSELEAITSIV